MPATVQLPLDPARAAGQQTRPKLGQLDALRGLAILMVLLVHSYLIAPFPLIMSFRSYSFIIAGQRGVQLFFLASAFTLALSNDRSRPERRPWRNFFLRRFFRIAPMFYVGILLTALMAPALSGGFLGAFLAATFLNGFHWTYMTLGATGGWSVANEAIFYAVFPLLFLVTRSVRSAALTLFATAAMAHFAIPYLVERWPGHEEFWSFFSTVAELRVFVSGMLGFQVWKALQGRTLPHKEISTFLLCIASLCSGYFVPILSSRLLPESLVLLLFVLALALHPWPLFVNRFTIYLGKISFSVYLLHSFVFTWMGRLLHARLPGLAGIYFAGALLLAGGAVVMLAATITWYLIERPGIQLGSAIIARLERRRAAASAVDPLASTVDTPAAQF